MLVRWMLPFPYIRRPTVLLVTNIVYEDPDELFSLFKYEFIFPHVRALNATIFNIQRPRLLLVRDIIYEDCKCVI